MANEPKKKEIHYPDEIVAKVYAAQAEIKKHQEFIRQLADPDEDTGNTVFRRISVQCGETLTPGPDKDRPGWFNWRNEPLKLRSHEQWKLLICIWGKTSVDFVTVGEVVWGSDMEDPRKIRTAVSRLNRTMQSLNVPRTWECVGQSINLLHQQ